MQKNNFQTTHPGWVPSEKNIKPLSFSLAQIFFSLLLGFLLTIFVLITSFSIITDKVLTQTNFQREVLTHSGYSRIVKPWAAKMALESIIAAQDSPVSLDIPFTTWQMLGDVLITDEWLETNTITGLNQTFIWLKSKDKDSFPDVIINTTIIAQNLKISKGKLAVLSLLQSLPPCKENTTPTYNLFADNCVPLGMGLTNIASKTALLMANLIPSEIVIKPEKNLPENLVRDLLTLKSFVLQYQYIWYILLSINVALLILYIFLYYKRLYTILLFLCIPLYISSGFILAIFGIWNLFRDRIIWEQLIQLSTDESLRSLIIAIVTAIMSEILNQWMKLGITLLGIAIFLHLAGFMYKKVSTKSTKENLDKVREKTSFRKQYR